MTHDVLAARDDCSMATVVNPVLGSGHKHVVVDEQRNLRGVLQADHVATAMITRPVRTGERIGELVSGGPPRVSPDATIRILQVAHQARGGVDALGVIDAAGTLIGLLTWSAIGTTSDTRRGLPAGLREHHLAPTELLFVDVAAQRRATPAGRDVPLGTRTEPQRLRGVHAADVVPLAFPVALRLLVSRVPGAARAMSSRAVTRAGGDQGDQVPADGTISFVRDVDPRPAPLNRFAEILAPDRFHRLQVEAERTRALLEGRTVWNLSSTAQGGGVAEMLQTLVAYGLGAGVETRWLVMSGDPAFFKITKRLHNVLHGAAGDGGDLGPKERAHYLAVQTSNLASAAEWVRPGDIVLVHDPQPAGMIAGLRRLGTHVVWRCHIGADRVNEHTERGWAFLREFIEDADRFVFSRREYAPAWVPDARLAVIAPSIDPFSTKNAPMSTDDVRTVLRHAGLIDRPPDSTEDHGSLGFGRRDGSRGITKTHAGLVLDGGVLPEDVRLVVQVSRWDRLKDMSGVLRAFAEHLTLLPDDVHLMLVGPEVAGVSDDPEGADVLAECRALWGSLPSAAQGRIHLICLPTDDPDENAHLVNALQRHATVVVQKSLVEGFGLTVTEPMWKARPVVASAVGGIRDQIEDGVSGLMLDDPQDLSTFAGLLRQVLADPSLASRLGAAARERVRNHYLGDRHLIQYGELLAQLLRAH